MKVNDPGTPDSGRAAATEREMRLAGRLVLEASRADLRSNPCRLFEVRDFAVSQHSLSLLHEINEESRAEHTEKSGKGDFPAAVRSLAVDLTRAGVDQDLISLLAIAVGQHPHRQQDVLEGDRSILGADVVDLLFVA